MKTILLSVSLALVAAPSFAADARDVMPYGAKFIACHNGDGLYIDHNKSLSKKKQDSRCAE